MADLDFINRNDVEYGTPYATSKGTLNVVNVKFSAQYKKQGVLFIGISPGVVDTGYFTHEMSTISPFSPFFPFSPFSPFLPSGIRLERKLQV